MSKKNEFLKCPYCAVLTLNEDDMKAHLARFGDKKHEEAWRKLHERIERGLENDDMPEHPTREGKWFKGKFGGELLLAEDPSALFYVKLINQNGGKPTECGNMTYKLSSDGKWLIRDRSTTI